MFSLTCQAPPKTPINLGLLLGLTNTLGAMSNYELHEACNRQGHYQSHSPLRKVIDAASKNMMVEGSSATPPHKATLTKSHPLGTSSATLSQSPSTTRVGAVVQKKTQPTPGPPTSVLGVRDSRVLEAAVFPGWWELPKRGQGQGAAGVCHHASWASTESRDPQAEGRR